MKSQVKRYDEVMEPYTRTWILLVLSGLLSAGHDSFSSSARDKVVQLDGFPDPNAPSIAMKSLKLGTIQPSRQDVVAW